MSDQLSVTASMWFAQSISDAIRSCSVWKKYKIQFVHPISRLCADVKGEEKQAVIVQDSVRDVQIQFGESEQVLKRRKLNRLWNCIHVSVDSVTCTRNRKQHAEKQNTYCYKFDVLCVFVCSTSQEYLDTQTIMVTWVYGSSKCPLLQQQS